MLVQFSVGNFRSIHEPVVLSMVATKRRSRVPGLDDGATFLGFEDLKLLKCAAIYGANASGKSNIVSALSFFRNFVLKSSKESQVDEPIGVQPFALVKVEDIEASTFEITFVYEDYLYQYGVEVDEKRVRSEYLKRKKANSKRVGVLFERNYDTIKASTAFKEGRGLESKTRQNALFLSVCANFDGDISTAVLRWFRNLKVVSGLHDEMLMPYTIKCFEDPVKKKKLSELLGKFDLGFERLELREQTFPEIPLDFPDELKGLMSEIKKIQKISGDKVKEFVSVHKLVDAHDNSATSEVHFSFSQESEGTRKLVAMAGPLLDVIESANVLVIDEFDARLHPVITRTILEIFNSSESNSCNAQLVVASHDTNLLDNELLRRDQVWFVEKDSVGASHLTSLEEFKVRNDASFEKDYISGKYGAIPFVGNVKRLFGGRRVNGVGCKSSMESKG